MTTNTSAVSAIGRRSTAGNTTIKNLRAAFGRWQERSRIRFELQQMNGRELADLGLSPSDINEVANGTYRRGE